MSDPSLLTNIAWALAGAAVPLLIRRGFAVPGKAGCADAARTEEHPAGTSFEREKASAALREAEARYRSIFENALEGIFQSTPDGSYVIVNPALARMYGYD